MNFIWKTLFILLIIVCIVINLIQVDLHIFQQNFYKHIIIYSSESWSNTSREFTKGFDLLHSEKSVSGEEKCLNQSTILSKIQLDISNGLVNSPEAKMNAMQQISTHLEAQLQELEIVENCSTATIFYCEQPLPHGFGHQVIHRTLCLFLGYKYKLSVILGKGAWPFRQEWDDIFIHRGSNCTGTGVGPNTVRFDWNEGGRLIGEPELLKHLPGCKDNNCTFIEFPFVNSSVIPCEFKVLLDYLQPNNSFIWWIGQFTKYLLKLQPSQVELIEQAKANIGFGNHNRPIIGLHIRRTDKAADVPLLPVEKYFEAAKPILTFFNLSSSINVFIATDDPAVVFLEAEAQNTTWKIIGFKNESTMGDQISRARESHTVSEIVRDIYLLAESDAVICTLSSNVCKIVWSLMSTKYLDISNRIKSLDHSYYFHLCCGLNVTDPKLLL